MNFTSNEIDFVKDNEAYVPIPESEKRRLESIEEFDAELARMREAAGGGADAPGPGAAKPTGGNTGSAGAGEAPMPDMRHCIIKGLDLAGRDLTNIDFRRATFDGCNLHGTDFSGSFMDNVAFYNNDLTDMKLCGCNARGCSFRFQDMTGIDLRGANIYSSVLEDAVNQDKVITDDDTKWYKMRCPEEGEAFIAWKCCTDLRVVMMLVPKDAKRCMATMETGRVSKVKVLKITSIDETESFSWAQSTVDPDFYYEVGKWIEPANGFQEDRWKDSSPGIHFFLDRQQCVDYQSK